MYKSPRSKALYCQQDPLHFWVLLIMTNLPHIVHAYRLVSVQSIHCYCCSLKKNCFWRPSQRILRFPPLDVKKISKETCTVCLEFCFLLPNFWISNLCQHISHYDDHSVLSEEGTLNPCNRDIFVTSHHRLAEVHNILHCWNSLEICTLVFLI